jgi:hypothetical protein
LTLTNYFTENTSGPTINHVILSRGGTVESGGDMIMNLGYPQSVAYLIDHPTTTGSTLYVVKFYGNWDNAATLPLPPYIYLTGMTIKK